MKQFTLSKKDKETLTKWGHPAEDFKQIELATNIGRFETSAGNNVNWMAAKRLVGSTEFLSGISRASFHWTAMRENSKTKATVYFDFSTFFRL